MELLREQWREAARGEVMGDVGFWVEDVEIRGMSITGSVVEGTGWRVIGSWDELRDAMRKGSYRSEGTYTTGEEGRTQFLSHPQRAMTWSGGAGRKWSPVALVEVDLADLPFRMLRSPEQWFPDDDDPTEGRIWPDVGTGLGIEGNIPLDRIKAVHLFSDGRIYESHTDWRALVAGAKQAVVADEDDWSLLEGDLPLTEADPDPQDPDVDLRSLSQMGVVEARCVLCGAFCGLHEGDYGDDWMFPVFIGKQGRIYCESCVFGYEHQFGKTVTASISKDAVRCTNAAFEAITGQCPNVEIIDGGHFLSLVREAGLGYEVLGRVAPTVRALMAMPEYQTGSYYLFTSGHAMALVDGVLTDTEERGPDGRRILGVYRIIRRSPVSAALSDFERGDRVEAAGESGSVVGIRGQGNAFTKGYILISFDSDPERPAWYPWREVRKVGKTAMALPDFKRTDDVEQMMDAYLDVIPSNDAAIIRSKRPKVVRHESAPRNAPSFAWYDGSNNTLNFLPGPITQDLISHEMTHALDALSGWISMTTAYKALCRGIRSGALTPQEVFVDAYMAAHFSGKQGVWFDGLPDDQRRGLIEIATNVARAASVLRTAMSLPDFKRTDRDMSEKQFISACKKILADVAKEMGFKGKLPEVVIQDLGGSSARSIDPGEMREFPNGAILVDPYDADSARQKDSGYSTFRVIAHEAIHALVQREMKSYAGSTQIITEGSAEILSVVYWAKNGPGYGGGGSKDLDAIHEQGYGWVGGDVALTSRINYPEYIVEVMRRAASKVGWDQRRIVAEVKRIASSDRNGAIDWLRETSADHPLPGGMPKTAEGMLLWLVRGA